MDIDATTRIGQAAFSRAAQRAQEPAASGEFARVFDLAPRKPKDHLMVVNLSGRGDKDLDSVAHHLGGKL